MPMKTIEGYSKEKYTNTSVLLAGGGAKALSDFIGSISWDSTNKKIKYTPIGGSATDLVTLSWDNIANKPTSLPANGGDADTVDNYHASNLAKFYLSPMSSNALADSAKSWFIDTMPSASGAIVYNVPGSEKTIIAGKSSGPYGHMLQLNYDDNYLRILRYQNGSWKTIDWEKVSAGYADSAGSVAWDNVTEKPFNWSGQSGQPTWIWGSNDGINYYVWNPSNFNVNYANSAGSVARATFGDASNGTHDANSITSNGLWYYSSNGPATSLGASTDDGALYSQAYSTSWVGQIAQDYRNGNLFTRGKNNGTWTDWKAISYVGHTHSYLPLSGGTLTGTLGKSNNYIFKPNGGDFRTITNSYTGAICISLPANIGNTMLSMWIDVYIYSPNKSFSIHVGGYTYNSNFSNSPFAMVYGASHKVRLTYDNGFKIYIGETNSTWSYPQISIRDVVLGFNQNYSNWSNDWSVSFVTSFPTTINREITRYAITTDNIKDQRVNFATSATNAENIFLKDASANSDCRLAFGTYNSTYIALNSSQYLTYNPYLGRLKLKGSKEHNSANHGGSISFGDGDFLYMKEAKDDMLLQHYKGLVSDTQPIAIGFVGSCPSNSSASLVYKKSQPSAITANCTRVSSGRFKVEVHNTSGKPIIAHLQVTPVRNYAQYEFAFAYIENFTMDTADGGMEIASGSAGYFYVRTGRIHCQSSWAAGDYVATGDTGGFTGVVYAMINESLATMPSTSW